MTTELARGVLTATRMARAHASITASTLSCAAVRIALLAENVSTRFDTHHRGAASETSMRSRCARDRLASASTALKASTQATYMALSGRLPAPRMSSESVKSKLSLNPRSSDAPAPALAPAPAPAPRSDSRKRNLDHEALNANKRSSAPRPPSFLVGQFAFALTHKELNKVAAEKIPESQWMDFLPSILTDGIEISGIRAPRYMLNHLWQLTNQIQGNLLAATWCPPSILERKNFIHGKYKEVLHKLRRELETTDEGIEERYRQKYPGMHLSRGSSATFQRTISKLVKTYQFHLDWLGSKVWLMNDRSLMKKCIGGPIPQTGFNLEKMLYSAKQKERLKIYMMEMQKYADQDAALNRDYMEDAVPYLTSRMRFHQGQLDVHVFVCQEAMPKSNAQVMEEESMGRRYPHIPVTAWTMKSDFAVTYVTFLWMLREKATGTWNLANLVSQRMRKVNASFALAQVLAPETAEVGPACQQLDARLLAHQQPMVQAMIARERAHDPTWTWAGVHDVYISWDGRIVPRAEGLKMSNVRPGGILVQNVGAGKTIEVLETVRAQWRPWQSPTLVLCPLTLVPQWKSECDKWGVRAEVVSSDKQAREVLHDGKCHVLIGTHTMCQKPDQWRSLFGYTWHRVVVDEVHRFKNLQTQSFRNLWELLRRLPHCILWGLTATPATRAVDLAAYLQLLRIASPQRVALYVQMARKNVVHPLQYAARRAILSQSPEALRDVLPALVKRVVAVPPDPEAIPLLKHLHKSLFLEKHMPWPAKFELVQLACTHPTLVHPGWYHYCKEKKGVQARTVTHKEACEALEQSHASFSQDVSARISAGNYGECPICMESPIDTPCMPENCSHLFCCECLEHWMQSSMHHAKCPMCKKSVGTLRKITDVQAGSSQISPGLQSAYERLASRAGAKVEHLLDMLRRQIPEEEKVVIALKSRKLYLHVKRHLNMSGISSAYLDGSMTIAQRERMIMCFQNERLPRVMLLTTRSAGEGLTLTRASHVMTLEPSLDSTTMQQIVGRVRRVNQSRHQCTLWQLSLDQYFDQRMQQLRDREESHDASMSAKQWKDMMQRNYAHLFSA